MVKGVWSRDAQGCRGPSLASPDHRLQGGLEADFHVQRVGALKVDLDVDVTDDDLVCQVEGVAVPDVGLIPLRWSGAWGRAGRNGTRVLSLTSKGVFLRPPVSCPPRFLGQKLTVAATFYGRGPGPNAPVAVTASGPSVTLRGRATSSPAL